MIELKDRKFGELGLVALNGVEITTRPKITDEPEKPVRDYWFEVKTPENKILRIRITLDKDCPREDRYETDFGRNTMIDRINAIKNDRVDLVVNPVDIRDAQGAYTTLFVKDIKESK